jgi:hypothetical protein
MQQRDKWQTLKAENCYNYKTSLLSAISHDPKITFEERKCMKEIIITIGDIRIQGELYDTSTAKDIEKILPLEGVVNRWGDELYFEIPLNADREGSASEDVDVGDLCYWPEGPAFCIFFGPTPVSTSERPRAYSPVNIFGCTLDNPKVLRSVKNGLRIRVSLQNQ